MVGGIGFLAAMLFMQKAIGTLSIQAMLAQSVVMHSTAAMLPIAFLCFAAFTKSAQLPSRAGCAAPWSPLRPFPPCCTPPRWSRPAFTLCCASPAFAGTMLAGIVSLTGAFTFVAASALGLRPEQRQEDPRLLHHRQPRAHHRVRRHGDPGGHHRRHPAHHLHAVSKGLLFLSRGHHPRHLSARVTSNPCAACTRSCPAWRSSRCSAS